MTAPVQIAPLTEDHWPAIAAIHREGIATGMATFDVAPAQSWAEWREGRISESCIIAVREGYVVGWAAFSATSRRACYAGVAEVSVYVAASVRGAGIGSLLLGDLIVRSEALGIWTLQATIFPENTASLRLHARHGFRVVGRRERIGQMRWGTLAGMWRDTLLLERRSMVVGV
jgi:phosphinothricin acetyltransferase